MLIIRIIIIISVFPIKHYGEILTKLPSLETLNVDVYLLLRQTRVTREYKKYKYRQAETDRTDSITTRLKAEEMSVHYI